MTFLASPSADVFPMVERFHQKRPSWTSESPGKRQQRPTQLQTSRHCAHIIGAAEIAAADSVSTIASGAVCLDTTQTGGGHQVMHGFSVSTYAEMALRKRIAPQSPPAAEVRMPAEEAAVQAEQPTVGQRTGAGRLAETQSSTLHGRREKRGRLYRGQRRWATITSKGKGRTSSTFEAKTAGDAVERTPSSSPSLSWEDVENSVAGINPVTTLFTECQGSTQRTCTHQRHLYCPGGREPLCPSRAIGNATSAHACEELQLSYLPTARCTRAHSAADSYRHSCTVMSDAAPHVDAKKPYSYEATSTPAHTFSDTARYTTFAGQVGGGGAAKEEATAVVCPSDGPRSLGAQAKNRQRAVSCPPGCERSLRCVHRSTRLYKSSSFYVTSFTSGSGEANDKANLPRVGAPQLSSSYTTGHYFSFSKSRTSEPSCSLHWEGASGEGFGSNPVRKPNRDAAEKSSSGVSARTASEFEHALPVICPFYARGLCPAGAAAAAAAHPALQHGKTHAESPAAEATPSIVTGCAVTASSTRESGRSPERLPPNFADRHSKPAAQVAPEHLECDACPYCMDTCDYLPCLRCLPRRCHPDALPPYSFNKECSKLASRAYDSCSRTHASVVGAGQSHSRDVLTDGLSCSRLISQTEDVGSASRSVVVEQGCHSCASSSQSWVRTASVPASGMKSETLKRTNAPESLHSVGSWAPCSWFPYRCLRVLAPPARPPISYSHCQVDRYCRNGGCWLLANGLIYDALPILYAHPGGPDCLLRKRGEDCSRDFAFHSKRGQQLWSNFVVGRIKPCRGWIEREQQQKELVGVSFQKEQEGLSQQHAVALHPGKGSAAYRATEASRSVHTSPSASPRSPGEVAAAEKSKPEQRKRFDTLTHVQGIIQRETATGQNNGRTTPGSSSTAEGNSFCRMM